MSQRIQFALSDAERETIFKDLNKFEHKQWPQKPRGATAWVRSGVRVVFKHNLRKAGDEWFVVRGDKTLLPLTAAKPTGISAVKVDVWLSEADRARVATLLKANVEATEAALLRYAVRFMAELIGALRHGELVCGRPDKYEKVDLVAITLDDVVPPTAAVGVTLPLTGQDESRPERAPNKRIVIDDSDEADVLWSTLLFVTTWNRWLAVRDAEVTALAQDSSRYTDSTFVSVERDYDLSTLLTRFWDKEQDKLTRGVPSYLSGQLARHRLIPASWRERAQRDVLAKARTGEEIVRAFIDARFKRLRPGGLQRERTTRDASRTSEVATPIRWRNWTRSCDLRDGNREVRAPIDWAAVMHHHLSKRRPGGSPELVAHDLQTWLSDTFGIRNARDFPKLVESCRNFNREFYGDAALSGGRVVEETDELLDLGKLLTVLGAASDATTEPQSGAKSADPYTPWARFMYLSLTITRCVRPVYSWQVAGFAKEQQAGQSLTAQAAAALEAERFASVQLGIRAVTYANLADLRARIFGAQTAIDGLHWILHGGIVPRSERGRVWIVSGRPGSGKSTFGLALASDMARRGHVSIVMLSEERKRTAEERLLMLGLRDPNRYDIVSSDRFEAMLDGVGDQIRTELESVSAASLPVKGLLVIFDAARMATRDLHTAKDSPAHKLELSSWLEWVSQRSRRVCEEIAKHVAELTEQPANSPELERLRGLRAARLRALQRRWQWLSLVVDSVDALEVEIPGLLATSDAAQADRTGMAKLVQAIEASRCWGILLCGEDNPRKTTLSYLSDTVIELGTDETRMQRTLRITKCRTQPYDAGSHVLSLSEGAGVVVYPNLPATQRVLRRRARRHLDSEHVIVIPDRIEWPGTPPASSPRPSASNLPTIRRGSAVLMYGERQSGKRPFLLNLMSQRMKLEERFRGWRNGATGAVLIVSFRGDGQDCLRPLEESKPLRDQWHSNVSDLQFKWYGADDAVTAAQVTHELVRRIQWSRRDGVPVDWIAFLGLEALKSTLPVVAAEPSFWPTILAIAANEEISTAFVANHENASFVAQHAEDMDYVLRFSRGSKHRMIKLEKSADMPPPDGYPTLELDLPAGTIRIVERDTQK